MRNGLHFSVLAGLVLLALTVIPVQADQSDDLINDVWSASDEHVLKEKPDYQKDAQDWMKEGDIYRKRCDERAEEYNKYWRETLKDYRISESLPPYEKHMAAHEADWQKTHPEEDRIYHRMGSACFAALVRYDAAIDKLPEDDYEQQARIYTDAARVYDTVGRPSEARKAREKALAAEVRAEAKEQGYSDCLIVTATFGSPMATEVQLVRTFRDDTVKQNYLGSRYVTALNAMYYSFSPVVARTIDENPSVKPVMRVILAPLISIVLLSQGVYSLLGFSPGVATIFFIIIGGSLVGLVYVLPVILPVIWLAVRRGWDIPPVGSIKSLVIMWAGLLAALLVSAVIQFDIVAVLSSGLLFVCTVFLTAGAVALYLFRCMEIQPVGLE